jgi:hypothetical protein
VCSSTRQSFFIEELLCCFLWFCSIAFKTRDDIIIRYNLFSMFYLSRLRDLCHTLQVGTSNRMLANTSQLLGWTGAEDMTVTPAAADCATQSIRLLYFAPGSCASAAQKTTQCSVELLDSVRHLFSNNTSITPLIITFLSLHPLKQCVKQVCCDCQTAQQEMSATLS